MLEGHAFVVEAAVSVGGRDIKPGINVYRFANRIPLLFEASHLPIRALLILVMLNLIGQLPVPPEAWKHCLSTGRLRCHHKDSSEAHQLGQL